MSRHFRSQVSATTEASSRRSNSPRQMSVAILSNGVAAMNMMLDTTKPCMTQSPQIRVVSHSFVCAPFHVLWCIDVKVLSRIQSCIAGSKSHRTSQVTFHELSQVFSRNLCIAEIVLRMRIFQVETLYMFPKQCFGHTYKVSALNSHYKCDFWHCIFSQDAFEELVKR